MAVRIGGKSAGASTKLSLKKIPANRKRNVNDTGKWNVKSTFAYSVPAIHAVTKHETFALKRARPIIRVMSLSFSGHNERQTPTETATEERLEKPHNAYVAIVLERACSKE